MRSAGGQAIVIGGGQNGLAAAIRLAAAGRSVLVLERRETVGGLSGMVEFHPGYRVPGILHDEGLMVPATVARLGLAAHGLAFREAPPVYLAEEGGPGILLHQDSEAAVPELIARSPHDAEAYRRYRVFLAKLRCADVLDWSRVLVDTSFVKAPLGGENAGRTRRIAAGREVSIAC